mmetsp:Transcript_32053/g.66922  ORF Transcript_32053/g.66922 Transcript_32053/m.66922 type:complete len:128 (-) Transcript_32053:134-517(-)|eukprot:CAMPEP_0172457090 /NCGR_PEP_ID=MMETSP1065-20121228/19797_1 /TAXON_ID=265537 /ORGANISM="Amphiprora paludosa, Strain CCMP125" /LENGTH=127 /DNA_ID=CAMNT_0013210577 /DNA_START=185 /DNA_END=568 /DNA_ORIENTATION=-
MARSLVQAPISLLVRLLSLLAMFSHAVESFQVSQKTSISRNLSTRTYSFSPLKSTQTQRLPAWITRPYKRNANMFDNTIGRDGDILMDGELIVGRLAMVGAVAFFTREIVTGASFAQQLHETLSSLS